MSRSALFYKGEKNNEADKREKSETPKWNCRMVVEVGAIKEDDEKK